jgi:hypothetical protein
MYEQMSAMQGPKMPSIGGKPYAPYQSEAVELEIATSDYSVAAAEYRLLGLEPPKHRSD